MKLQLFLQRLLHKLKLKFIIVIVIFLIRSRSLINWELKVMMIDLTL